MAFLKALGRLLGDLIWPQGVLCLACRRPSGGEHLCPACQQEMARLHLDEDYTHDPQAFFRAVWKHDGAARALVLRLKHHNEAVAARVLAHSMAEAVHCMELPADTVLTWVPMPAKRRMTRGIDHGFCLASALGEELHLPVRPLLRRTRATAAQARLDHQQRRMNLVNAFAALEEIHSPVLLVDDVYTTGATATVCTDALLAAGSPWVKVITATQAVHRGTSTREDGQWKLENHT